MFLLALFLARSKFDLGGIQQLIDVGVRAQRHQCFFGELDGVAEFLPVDLYPDILDLLFDRLSSLLLLVLQLRLLLQAPQFLVAGEVLRAAVAARMAS